MRDPLRHATVGCHLALAVILTGAILVPDVSAVRLGSALVVLAPLLALLPGLVAARATTEGWLAAALVPYIGALCVEVVARGGTDTLLAIALLAAVAELGLLLALSRRPRAVRE